MLIFLRALRKNPDPFLPMPIPRSQMNINEGFYLMNERNLELKNTDAFR